MSCTTFFFPFQCTDCHEKPDWQKNKNLLEKCFIHWNYLKINATLSHLNLQGGSSIPPSVVSLVVVGQGAELGCVDD